MNTFLEVLGQVEAKLTQMTEQAEIIRLFANSERLDAAYEHALHLAENLEQATLLGRVLPAYTGRPSAKKDVGKIITDTIQVEAGFTQQGWFCLGIPSLLPKKAHGSADYVRSYLYPAVQKFFMGKEPIRYSDCVMIFRHVYSRDRPEHQWRDHDNIEVNIVADIVALYTMPDDTPTVCKHYHCSAAGDEDHTEVYVVPREDFPAWLDVEESLTDERWLLSEYPDNQPGKQM